MTAFLRVCVAVSLLGASLPRTTYAQTKSASGKPCVLPMPIYQPEPPPSHYPRKDSAVATLEITIDEKGRVLDPKVITSSGIDEFDHDALVAVQKWRFKPSTCDGKPVVTHIAVQVKSTVTH